MKTELTTRPVMNVKAIGIQAQRRGKRMKLKNVVVLRMSRGWMKKGTKSRTYLFTAVFSSAAL